MYLTIVGIRSYTKKNMHIVKMFLCFCVQVLLLIVPASGASLAAGEYGVSVPANVVANIVIT